MKNEMTVKKFMIRLIIGSILFAIILCGRLIFAEGVFHISGVLWCIYSAVSFGALFFLASRFLLFKKIWQQDKTQTTSEK